MKGLKIIIIFFVLNQMFDKNIKQCEEKYNQFYCINNLVKIKLKIIITCIVSNEMHTPTWCNYFYYQPRC